MKDILTKDEYILFNDEEGLIVTNKKIVMIEADNIQTDYHCYPLFSIIKFVITSSKNLRKLSIELKDLTITIGSDACDKISEIPEYGEIELYNFIINDIIHHIIIKDKRLDFISRNKYLYIINLYLLLRNFYEEETK